jgi:hypothetical protein
MHFGEGHRPAQTGLNQAQHTIPFSSMIGHGSCSIRHVPGRNVFRRTQSIEIRN